MIEIEIIYVAVFGEKIISVSRDMYKLKQKIEGIISDFKENKSEYSKFPVILENTEHEIIYTLQNMKWKIVRKVLNPLASDEKFVVA